MFIDLHTHALPGMDDGAADVRESIAMLQNAFAQGVNIVALTSHCTVHHVDSVERFLEKRQAAFQILQEAVEQNKAEIPKLLLGAEVYADHDISRVPDIGKLCLEGTNYLLMEFAFGDDLSWLSECVYSLNRMNITAMIAHVDRYVQREQIFADLKGLNVVYQLNTTSILSFSGRGILKKMMSEIQDSQNCFFVSSDMHNCQKRTCDMEKAYMLCKKKYPNISDDLFLNNAKYLLNL